MSSCHDSPIPNANAAAPHCVPTGAPAEHSSAACHRTSNGPCTTFYLFTRSLDPTELKATRAQVLNADLELATRAGLAYRSFARLLAAAREQETPKAHMKPHATGRQAPRRSSRGPLVVTSVDVANPDPLAIARLLLAIARDQVEKTQKTTDWHTGPDVPMAPDSWRSAPQRGDTRGAARRRPSTPVATYLTGIQPRKGHLTRHFAHATHQPGPARTFSRTPLTSQDTGTREKWWTSVAASQTPGSRSER